MKKYIFSLFAVLALVCYSADAQDTSDKDTMNVNKTATYNYTTHEGLITLESFVPGEMVVTAEAKPVDIIFVMDFSGSMGPGWDSDFSNSVSYSIDTLHPVSYSMYYDSKYTKYHWFGVEKTITVVKLKKEDRTSGYKCYWQCWSHFTDGGKRYYVTPDGEAHQAANTTDPTWDNPPLDVDGNKIMPATTHETNGSTPKVLYSDPIAATIKSKTRIAYLTKGVCDFIDVIKKSAKDGGVNHRVAMIQFQDGRYPRFSTTDSDSSLYIKSGSANYLREWAVGAQFPNDLKRTSVMKHFRSISTDNDARFMKSLMSGMTPNGLTSPSYGMKLASLMSSEFRSNAAPVVIVFSDGMPEVLAPNTTTPVHDTWTDTYVKYEANRAVKLAKELKDKGAIVYSVYCEQDKDNTNETFLKNVSSNTKTSTSYDNKTFTDTKYYKYATDSLAVILKDIAGDIVKTIVMQYDSKTIMKDFINNTYFKLPDDVTEANKYEKILVYENPLEAYDSTATTVKEKYTFSSTRRRLTHEADTITISIFKATGTPPDTADHIEIKGYDYSKNWCGWDKKENKVRGNRLVIEIPFVFTGGEEVSGELPTNTGDSGVYPVKKDSTGKVITDPVTGDPVYDDPKPYPVPVIKFSKIRIERSNLDPGESAIYTVYMRDTTKTGTDSTFVCRVTLNGEHGAETVSRTLYGLQGGPGIYYTVTETQWNWAYTKNVTKIRKEVNQTETSVVFPFSGSHKSGVDEDPAEIHNHDEVYVLNHFDLSKLPFFVPFPYQQ